MKKIRKFLGAAILASTLLSCADELSSEPSIDGFNTPLVVNGRLSFENESQLRSLIKNFESDEQFKFQLLKSLENEGFESLLPVLNENSNQEKINDYISFKREDYQKIREQAIQINALNEFAMTPQEEYEFDIEEDILISDSDFAALLNQRREVTVNDVVYWYTTKGVLYVREEEYPQLRLVHDGLSNCPHDEFTEEGGQQFGDVIVDDFGGSCNPGGPVFPPDYPDGSGGSGGPGSGPNSGDFVNQIETKILFNKNEVNNLPECDYQPGFLAELFGGSESCYTKFDGDKRRIKTKAWSQNFVIYSSVGMKTKSQKKKFGVWWAKDAEEIHLGHSIVSFSYELPTISPWERIQPIEPQFQFKQYKWNRGGDFLNGDPLVTFDPYEIFPDDFPFTSPSSPIIKIILPTSISEFFGIDEDDTTLTGGDLNDLIQNVIQDGFIDFVESFVPEDEDRQEIMNSLDEVAIVAPIDGSNRVRFLSMNYNRVKFNENKIKDVYDWNSATFEISFNPFEASEEGLDAYSFQIADGAYLYEEFQLMGYGMCKFGDRWYGNRIKFIQDTF